MAQSNKQRLPGEDTSIWVDTTPATSYKPLQKGEIKKCDVAIMGGGMTGLLAAWFLERSGLRVVVLDKGRIVSWTTGYTTAKVTSQHNLIYDFLIKKHGEEKARLYADANQQAIDDIEDLGKELNIDHDFSRRDAYAFATDKSYVPDIENEVAAAKRLGLPASFETETDLPFAVAGAIKFSNQAQFHPRKFLLGLAKQLVKEDVRICENTEVVGVEPGIIQTKSGELKADYIVDASNHTLWRSRLFQKHMWTKLSYAYGVLLEEEDHYPQGMYISVHDPLRTIRSHPYKKGQMLIFGGNSHNEKDDTKPDEQFRDLERDLLKSPFAVKKIVYRWLAGDLMPYDRVPYIGPYPKDPSIYVATGFQAWGLTTAMVAAHIIRDSIAGKENPWAEVYNLDRLALKA